MQMVPRRKRVSHAVTHETTRAAMEMIVDAAILATLDIPLTYTSSPVMTMGANEEEPVQRFANQKEKE